MHEKYMTDTWQRHSKYTNQESLKELKTNKKVNKYKYQYSTFDQMLLITLCQKERHWC